MMECRPYRKFECPAADNENAKKPLPSNKNVWVHVVNHTSIRKLYHPISLPTVVK
jgi:hypothetical protein